MNRPPAPSGAGGRGAAQQIPVAPLAAFYFFYFAVLGGFMPYWGLYLRHLDFSPAAIGQLMAILAPLVMGALANHAQGQGVGAGGLGGLLAQEVRQVQQQGGSAGGLLDSVLGNSGGLAGILQSAGGLLGAFTKR